MENKPLLLIMAANCQLEAEAKFNKWYEEVHIPNVMKFKGLKKATRYHITIDSEEYPKYLVAYEFESKKAFEE